MKDFFISHDKEGFFIHFTRKVIAGPGRDEITYIGQVYPGIYVTIESAMDALEVLSAQQASKLERRL